MGECKTARLRKQLLRDALPAFNGYPRTLFHCPSPHPSIFVSEEYSKITSYDFSFPNNELTSPLASYQGVR